MGIQITAVRTEILDVPIKRPHQFSAAKMTVKPFLLLQIDTNEGITGIGEGTTPGIWWNGESVETMQTVIEHHIGPLLIGQDPQRIEALFAKIDKQVRANPFAKATVEMALYDIVGKLANVPVYQLLGGLYQESIPVRWALAIGKPTEDSQEAEGLVREGKHTVFKMKAGSLPPSEDAERAIATAELLRDKATTGIDPNGCWDELTINRYMDRFQEAGLDFLEQPLPVQDFEGLARLTASSKVPIMADESASSVQDAYRLAQMHAAHIFSLKIHKSGGMSRVKKVGAIAEAAGIACFGGTSLESSIGTAACLHVYCTLPNLTAGSELFGPIWLADDLVTNPVQYRGDRIFVPNGPGLGVSLDEAKIEKYRRRT